MQGFHCRKKEGRKMNDAYKISSYIRDIKEFLIEEGIPEKDTWKLIELSLLWQRNEAIHELANNIEGIEHIIGKVCSEGIVFSGDVGMEDVANSILEACSKGL